MTELNHFVPQELENKQIELRDDLIPVIDRIAQKIPPEKVWEMFSSQPTETGGRIVFPYFRVDGYVIVARDSVWMLEEYKEIYNTPEKIDHEYAIASLSVLRALLWVEVGFEGLENLSKSRASRNWTTAVGHHVDDDERARRIMTSGKELYVNCIRAFVDYRSRHNITNDCFAEYGLEYLLESFRESNPESS